MPFEIGTNARGSMLTLTGRLGIQQARPLWEAMETALIGCGALLLQAEAAEEIDTSIAQILCRAVDRNQLEIGSASDGFIASLQSRGLGAFFTHAPAPSMSVQSTAPQPMSKPVRAEKRRSPRSLKKAAIGSVQHG